MRLDQLKLCQPMILGCGVEGWSCYTFLRRQFPGLLIGVSDRRPLSEFTQEQQEILADDPNADLHFGEEWLENWEHYTVIIKSPGISLNQHPEIEEAVLDGRVLTSATNIFMQNAPGRIIGVTGTKGKSTTATLIHRILEEAGMRSFLLGNIGVPALDHFEDLDNHSWTVMELSSYQLETAVVSPHIAVFTSFFPDHLDYHGGIDDYFEAKARIITAQNATGTLVYNCHYEVLQPLAHVAPGLAMPFNASPGCRLDDDGHTVIYGHPPEDLFSVEILKIPGRHNVDNAMAAATTARLLEVPGEVIRNALAEFEGLPHRLQYLGHRREIHFFNDALSTTPECTLEALDAVNQVVDAVIVGGSDRGYDFSELANYMAQLALRAVAFLPPSGQRIKEALEEACADLGQDLPAMLETTSMDEAVAFCAEHTSQGAAVLLSPGSPSYSLFKSYIQRGEAFIAAVEAFAQNEEEPHAKTAKPQREGKEEGG